MSYYVYGFRQSAITGRDSPRNLVEESLPRDEVFQEAAAEAIEALGWERFVIDFAEAAAAMGVTVDEARAAFVNIELNYDAPMLQVQVMPYGLEVQMPWFQDAQEQHEAMNLVRSVLAAAHTVDPLMVFDPQVNNSVSSFSALSQAYRSAAARSGEFVQSPEFQEQLKTIFGGED